MLGPIFSSTGRDVLGYIFLTNKNIHIMVNGAAWVET